MKKFIMICLLMTLSFMIVGCNEQGTQSKEKSYTETMKQQSLAMVGLPDITNFFEMAQLKEIYELRDDPKAVMHWYTRNEFTGKWVYEGKCLGFGIPYGASITNPEQRIYGNAGAVVLPLAEPNGLYTNNVTSSATWILAIDEQGKIHPNYVENTIRVSPTKIRKELVESYSITNNY